MVMVSIVENIEEFSDEDPILYNALRKLSESGLVDIDVFYYMRDDGEYAYSHTEFSFYVGNLLESIDNENYVREDLSEKEFVTLKTFLKLLYKKYGDVLVNVTLI